MARAVDAPDPGRRLRRLTLVLNENDAAVSNPAARRTAAGLGRVAEHRVDHVFPASAGLKHDLIDPEGENAGRIREIYAALGPLLDLPDLAG